MGNSESNILRLKWFNTIQDIVDTYNNTENLKKLLTTLNKTLGLTTKNPIFFSVTVTRKILGIHYTYHLCVNIIVIIPDPPLITVQDVLSFMEIYESWILENYLFSEINIEVSEFK